MFVNIAQLVIDGDLRQFEACRSSRSIATTAKLKQSERNSWEWGLRCRMNHAQHELRVCAASGPCCGRQPGPLRGKKIALTAGRYSFQTVQWVVVGKSQNPKNPKIPKFKNLKINVRGGCDCTGKQVWRRLACKGPRLVDWVGCGRSAVSLLGRRALHQSSALRLRGLLAASLTRVLNSSWFPLSPGRTLQRQGAARQRRGHNVDVPTAGMQRRGSNGKAPTARLQRRGSDGEAPTAWLQRRGYDVRRLFEPKWLRESVVHGMMSLSFFTTASALVPLSSVMRPLPHPPQIADRTRVAGSCYIFQSM